MGKKLRISLGTNNFGELVTTSDVFVDKSLLIQEVIDSGEKAILITRPRRWGKSLALDMLKTFFSIELDNEGNKKEYNSNRVLFDGGEIELEFNEGKKQLPKLKIAKENHKYLAIQGQYPVIHVNFKDVKALSYEKISKLLKIAIKEAFKEHEYLINSLKLSTFQKAELNKYYTDFLNDDALDEARLKGSILFLSELLETHHNRKVYILVDEYDKPVNYFLEKDLTAHKEVRSQVVSLVETILSKCGKDNKHLQKIILTGIFDSLEKEGNSGFNNVATYGITDENFGHHFGFSTEEVKTLVQKLNFQNPDTIHNNVKDWYNGYSIPVHGNKNIQAYTPWAVMRYLKAAYNDETTTPENYWVQSGASTMFQALLKDAECKETPFMNSLLNITANNKVSFPYKKGASLFQYPLEDASQDERIFSSLLLNSGYLTSSDQNKTHITLAIPNFEVKEELKDVFDSHVKHVKDKKGQVCQKIQANFYQEDYIVNYINFAKTVINQDLTEIELYLQRIKCTDQNYIIPPLHLSALAGDVSIFKLVANKCKESAFEKSNNLTIADYAYMSSNQELYDETQKYGAELSLKIPRFSMPVECMISNNINSFLSSTIVSVIITIVVERINQGNFPWVINNPWSVGIITTSITALNVYFLLTDYTENCDAYNKFRNVKYPSLFTQSLDEFLKHKLLYNDTTKVRLNQTCQEDENMISKSSLQLLSNTDSNEENHLDIVLCSGKIADNLNLEDN